MATGVEVSKPSMEIRFQPALLQEVIDSFIEKTEREGDPELKQRVGIVLVKGVLKEDQEGVDVLRKWGSVEHDLAKQFEEKGLKGVGIKLIPRRFYDPALTRYCRHELLHIHDMLDPAFGYDPDTRVGQNPGDPAPLSYSLEYQRR